MNMKSIVVILACCLALCLEGTASYTALSLPPPRRQIPTNSPVVHDETPTPIAPPAVVMKSVLRRAKNKLQTIVRKRAEESAKKKPSEPEQMWRVLFHDTEYLPGHVARALSKVFPISRKAAFEICLRAREEGVVPLTICNKKEAEKYCGKILRQGLKATIEPLDMT